MTCSVHLDRRPAGTCQNCGRFLCWECAGRYEPPTCPSCLQAWRQATRSTFVRHIVVGSVIGVLAAVVALVPATAAYWQAVAQHDPVTPVYGLVLMGVVVFVLYACVPFGWAALAKLTPRWFMVLPLIGWALYFAVKVVVSAVIGVFVLPFAIHTYVKAMSVH